MASLIVLDSLKVVRNNIHIFCQNYGLMSIFHGRIRKRSPTKTNPSLLEGYDIDHHDPLIIPIKWVTGVITPYKCSYNKQTLGVPSNSFSSSALVGPFEKRG